MSTQETGEHERHDTHARAPQDKERREARPQATGQRSKTDTKAETAGGQTPYEIKASNLTEEDRKFLEQYADTLSKSTLRAKWIHSPDEHEDYPGQTLATRNHDVIMRWAQERQATPATVPGTEHGTKHVRPGVLTFDFPGYRSQGQDLKAISWDEWFKSFDVQQLVFVYQEHMKNGKQSNFFHLDNPKREHD